VIVFESLCLDSKLSFVTVKGQRMSSELFVQSFLRSTKKSTLCKYRTTEIQSCILSCSLRKAKKMPADILNFANCIEICIDIGISTPPPEEIKIIYKFR
jgi:hypothetical protein